MPSPFTIIGGKEGSEPKGSVFLVSIAAPANSVGYVDVVYLTTRAYIGAPNIVYNGNTYAARILRNDIQPIQAGSPQGFDTVPGFSMTLADADGNLWNNHCALYGWRGAVVTLTVILWDVVNNAYSTDAYQFTFIGGNPQHTEKTGETTLDTMAATNFARLKVPSIPLQFVCPWVFPATAAQRFAALNDPTSVYYQCGYSPDQTGGVGNYASVGVCFTACDHTRSGGPYATADHSVGCMARMGHGANTSVAPDGDLSHDIAGNYTARFGGVTLIMPALFSGRSYVSGQKVFGFNPVNGALAGSYFNWVIGTQWANAQVLAPAGDSNSLRTEAVVCVAAFGATQIWQVVVNGVIVSHDNTNDELYTWRFAKENPTIRIGIDPALPPYFAAPHTGSGGRSGAINGDSYFSSPAYSGLGDPHGSLCVIEVVVPVELASTGSVPTVQVLVTGDWLLNCYPIATAVGSGGEITITFPAGFTNSTLIAGMQCVISNNSWSAANGAFVVDVAVAGPPGTVTLLGTAATGSGTGGGVYFFLPPDQMDGTAVWSPSVTYPYAFVVSFVGVTWISNAGGNLGNRPSYTSTFWTGSNNPAGPAANLAWAVMTMMTWGNITGAQFDPLSWYNAAQICARPMSYIAANGTTQVHAQFKACLALSGSSRQTLAQVLTGLKNAGNLMTGPNSITGLIQAFVRESLVEQQPAPIPGSNYNTGISSPYADSTIATPHLGTGYFAYYFNESNIEPGSFRLTSTRIESTPNTVSFPFQDELNGYQTDSLSETDAAAYAYSGNQEVEVPIPMLGIPNFDQATRQANVQIAEALFGNYRNDQGGTLYAEFSTNMRVLHLVQRLGYICGLTWTSRNIGTGGTPQAFRIVSLKPDTDGAHWLVKMAWHEDQWYLYEYGQNPTPYQVNPLLTPPARPPYPWVPGQLVWGSADALFPNQLGFNFDIDLTQAPAQISITGAVPINAAPSGLTAIVPIQGGSGNTGGNILPGAYQIMFSSNGLAGPMSNPIPINVFTGTSTNTITISGLSWRGTAAPSIQPYIGRNALTMRACAPADYTGSVPDAQGNPTTYVFNRFTGDGTVTLAAPAGEGLPDIVATEFLVQMTGIAHGGVWGDDITTVTGSGLQLNFPEVTWTSNQWAGYVLSLYFRPNVTVQPALNMAVSSSGTNFLTMAAAGFLAGDVVVMRAKTVHTLGTLVISDPNWNNWYSAATSGLTAGAEVGNRIMFIAGTGAGSPPVSITANTGTDLSVAGWIVEPDSTSVYIILSSTISYNVPTNGFAGGDGQTAVPIATIGANITSVVQSLLVQVACADSNGNTSPMAYQPFREVYVPSLSDTTLVTS